LSSLIDIILELPLWAKAAVAILTVAVIFSLAKKVFKLGLFLLLIAIFLIIIFNIL
jgi:hypothetical protein